MFVVLFALGGTLKELRDQWKNKPALLPKKDAEKPLVYMHKPPPLPLDGGVDNSYVDPRLNADFRASTVRRQVVRQRK